MPKFKLPANKVEIICIAQDFRSVRRYSRCTGTPLNTIRFAKRVSDVKGLSSNIPVVRINGYWLHEEYLELINWLIQNYFIIEDWEEEE